MGWGTKSTFYRGFDDLKKELQYNKSKTKFDRKIDNETWAIVRKGTLQDPEIIVVKHHRTDILTFYKDGSFDVNCDWRSVTTKDRISSYSHVYIGTHTFPTVNGLRPKAESVDALFCGSMIVPAHGTITIEADGTVDLDTVREYEMVVIKDPSAVRKAVRQLSKVCQQVDVRRKLGAYPIPAKPLNRLDTQGPISGGPWLLDQLGKSVDEVDYASIGEPYMRYGMTSTGLTYGVANRLGATAVLKVKIFPTSAVTI